MAASLLQQEKWQRTFAQSVTINKPVWSNVANNVLVPAMPHLLRLPLPVFVLRPTNSGDARCAAVPTS